MELYEFPDEPSPKKNRAVTAGVVIIICVACVICAVGGTLALTVFENRTAAVPTARPLPDSNPPEAVAPPATAIPQVVVPPSATAIPPASVPPTAGVTPLTGASIGLLAPDFELTTSGGQTVRLYDLRGQAVLINFWATWCGYCLEEMPLMQQYYNLYASDLVILAVNEGETQYDVSNFISSYGYTFTFLMDQDYRAGDAYQVDGYPITFFVDAAGIIRHRVDGTMGEQDMLNGLSAIGVGR